MRLIYRHEHQGIWFSHNGHRAYEKGERPLCLLVHEWCDWEETAKHHIARRRGTEYTRELVMFYRNPKSRRGE
jgi:hypothetical protein